MNFYKNGNYIVCIMDDGTKIRRTDEDEFIPQFAENVDVCITKKCSQRCPFCYEGCTVDGQHCDISKYFKLFSSLHPYTEMALNGNDLDHPQLETLLYILKSRKVFANITVSQNQFMNNLTLIDKLIKNKLIYGLGISYQYRHDGFIEQVQKYHNAVIHTINGILNENDIEFLSNKDLNLLILGYKNLGRGVLYKNKNFLEIKNNISYLNKTLPNLKNSFNVVSFDNLALEQLNVKRLMTDEEWDEFYMGDDSSSVHSIQVSRDNMSYMENLPDVIEFTGGEFGWGWETYNSYQDKYNYLIIAIMDNCDTLDEYYEKFNKVKDILLKWNIDVVSPDVVQRYYDNYPYLKIEDYEYSYIDHVKELSEFVNCLIGNEEFLMVYLFSDTSYIVTGNDNDDTPDDLYPESGNEILYEFEKGN